MQNTEGVLLLRIHRPQHHHRSINNNNNHQPLTIKAAIKTAMILGIAILLLITFIFEISSFYPPNIFIKSSL